MGREMDAMAVPFGRRAWRTLLLLLLFTAPLPASAAESVHWSPPPVGMTAVYRVWLGNQPLEIAQRVVEVLGDEVVVESLSPAGQPPERYFRYLLSKESQGALYSFDEAAVAALWPLEVGKRAAARVEARLQGRPLGFDWVGEVVRFEDMPTAAGTFRTVRVAHTLVAPGQVTIETLTWLDVEQGFPVRTETTVTVTGQQPQLIVLELQELR